MENLSDFKNIAFPGKVLVIDDEESPRVFLRATLEKAGYEVVEAEDGRTGIKESRRVKPDAILLDQMMPEMDGCETCCRIRAFDADVPVLIVTGLDNSNIRAKVISSGANDYILKPVDTGDVLIRVKNAVQMSQLKRELDHQIQAQQREAEIHHQEIVGLRRGFQRQMNRLTEEVHQWADLSGVTEWQHIADDILSDYANDSPGGSDGEEDLADLLDQAA